MNFHRGNFSISNNLPVETIKSKCPTSIQQQYETTHHYGPPLKNGKKHGFGTTFRYLSMGNIYHNLQRIGQLNMYVMVHTNRSLVLLVEELRGL